MVTSADLALLPGPPPSIDLAGPGVRTASLALGAGQRPQPSQGCGQVGGEPQDDPLLWQAWWWSAAGWRGSSSLLLTLPRPAGRADSHRDVGTQATVGRAVSGNTEEA